jgi:hypothetical protein
MSYKYTAFGLNLLSEFIIGQLEPVVFNDDQTDVRITSGSFLESMAIEMTVDPWYHMVNGELIFWAEDVAAFKILGTTEIMIEPFEGGEMSSIDIYILGTAMGVILHRRGLLVLHGGAVNIQGQAVIITGDSGAGKSSLTNALYQRGYDLITDDLSVIEVSNPSVMIPSYPKQKLWRDSVNVLGHSIEELITIDNKDDKYYLHVDRFELDKVPVGWVVYLDVNEDDELITTELNGIEKLEVLLYHTYRSEMIKDLGLVQQHFHLCSKLLENIKVIMISRPEGRYTLDQQIHYIETTLDQEKIEVT